MPTTDDYDKYTEQHNKQQARTQRLAKGVAFILILICFILLCAFIIFTIQKF